jgi:polyhydroxyalkanoate synthesis repressor PhaR
MGCTKESTNPEAGWRLPKCLAYAKRTREGLAECDYSEMEPFLPAAPSPVFPAELHPSIVVTIKKYANRRLYNTATSAYVTLEYLAQMVRDGVDFVVVDAKTSDDITRSILAQIILDAENSGNNLLPVGFLRSIIRSYGDSVQGFLPSYLDLAMKSFADSREQFAKSMSGGIDLAAPVEFFEQAVRANMAVMAEAARAFSAVVVPSKSRANSPPAEKSDAAEDLASLRAQMATMQARLDKLDGAAR